MKVTFIAFNIGPAGRYPNGPGMSLYNLIKFIKKEAPGSSVEVYSKLPYGGFDDSVVVKNISNKISLHNSIIDSDVVHHWSGIGSEYSSAIRYANKNKRPVVIGPNVFDCVNIDDESKFLKEIDFNLILSVNDRLRYLIAHRHKLLNKKIKTFIVGPDIDLWSPAYKKEYDILWKGNSRHFVKDIDFALEVKNKIGSKYSFRFIGHPLPYDYFSHIEKAKAARLYFSTSLSETKGMALMEQWSAGVPSVTHSKIYMHGLNYKTGIITNRDVASYCDAISEIMENSNLYKDLSTGCRDYMTNNFSSRAVCDRYTDIIGDINVG